MLGLVGHELGTLKDLCRLNGSFPISGAEIVDLTSRFPRVSKAAMVAGRA